MKFTNPDANGNGTTVYDPKGYEGWKNRATWKVSLWLNNDYGIYISAVQYMKNHPQSTQPYSNFVRFEGLEDERTPDRIKWLSNSLDYKALDKMMRELVA